ncbi:MAG: hypothetical protein HQ478_05825 [Chloroflexi bacterium]|nr:hypothetical protein [Chloroflexota bacterium]
MVRTVTSSRVRAPIIAAAIAALVIVLSAGCGSDNAAAPDDASSGSLFKSSLTVQPGEPDNEIPVIVRAGDTFTKDSFLNAGWKTSKQLGADEVDGATSAWYGFHNQRDIWLWIYETNEGATNVGAPIARAAIKKIKSNPVYARGYKDYMIVGNVVVLCELEIAICEGMVSEL